MHVAPIDKSPAGSDCCRSEPWDAANNDETDVKGKGERMRNLMVSMIDGCFKSRGSGAVSIVSANQRSTATTTPTPPCGLGPAVYLTVHLREGLTKVKVVVVGVWQGVCAVPLRDVPRGTVPGCAVGRRDRASPAD